VKVKKKLDRGREQGGRKNCVIMIMIIIVNDIKNKSTLLLHVWKKILLLTVDFFEIRKKEKNSKCVLIYLAFKK